MIMQERFIERLKKAMTSSSLNARELSKRCGLSEGAISRYLSGKMEPRVPAVAKMAEALHVDPVWLLGIDDNSEPDFSIDTAKIAILIESMSSDEKSQVENFVKFIISNRGGNNS